MNVEKSLTKHIPTLLSLWRGNKNTSPLNSRELSSVSQALLSLQRGLTGNRKLAGSGYMDNKDHLGAYLLYYWPVSYMQISYAINSCTPFLQYPESSDSTVTILDIGSGPAPASMAICDLLSSITTNQIEVTLVDSSTKAMELAKRIYGDDNPNVKVRTIKTDLQQGLPPVSTKFDIIVMSHSINELWKDKADKVERRSEFINHIAENLKPTSLLLISEPALLETSRSLIQVRDELIKNGFSVLSPCLKSHPCPVLSSGPNHTCHSEIQWNPCEPVASIARSAKLDRESVKMTFFAFCKADSVPIQPDNASYRVVSDGMLNKSGRIRYLLCDGEKRIPLSAKNGDSNARQNGFFNLQRYDTVKIQSPEIRGDRNNHALGISDNTKLEIIPFSK
ncbi:MAG: methyltransferase [Treponema sp.]|nr:methyltransferase [Treponema sp.]